MAGGIVLPPGSGSGLFCAFTSQAFNTNPSWNPLTGVQSFSVSRGSDELLTKIGTGTATINLLDETGKYDPMNANGPFYKEIGPMRSVNIQMLDYGTNQFRSIFTGFTETWDFTYPATPAAVIAQAAVSCVDGFDALQRAEMPPDAANTTTIPPFVGLDAVKGRIFYILSFFSAIGQYAVVTNGYPTDPQAIFSGNVNVLSAVYNPQTGLLTGMQDTGDAEFPNLNQLFMDKWGNVAFRGRGPRFKPQNYTVQPSPPTLQMPITFWNVGDANACATWPTNPPGSPSSGAMVPFNDPSWDIDQTRFVNAAQVYPGNIGTQQSAITNQTATNGVAIGKYGPRVLSIPNLYTGGSPAVTGDPFLNPPGLTAKQECLLFADYFEQNLADPQPHFSALKFITVPPGTTKGNAFWHFVTGVEIGDVIVLYQTDPGGGGFFARQFFVEKLDYSVTLGGPYPQITLTVGMAPREWFSTFNGFSFYPATGIFGTDGNPTHGSNVFNAPTANPFTINSVGKILAVADPSTNITYSFEITGFTSASTVTLNTTYVGVTTMAAPYEIITP